MKYVIFLLGLVALPMFGQPSDDARYRREKAKQRQAENRRNISSLIESNRKAQEELIKLNEERRAEQTATVQQQQAMASAYSGGYGYNRVPQMFTTSQDGSVAIAEHAAVTVDPVKCLVDATAVMKSTDKAADYCQKIFDREAKRSEKVANEAADAARGKDTKAYFPRYGW